MKTVEVSLGARSYPIRVGRGLLNDANSYVEGIGRQVLIVTDENVAPLYLERISIPLADRELASLILPAGESNKTLLQAARIIDVLINQGMRRDACIVALGGGVVGDMAGFAASCYMRGIAWVQVPTTLLAQVDASVGGKTGVNHPEGKNLIGSFHQPRAVLTDTETLDTLADREYRAGLAEVIKYGVGLDIGFFAWLEANMADLITRDPAALEYAVSECCRLKAVVVAEDEHDRGPRALLNLGHTFAHGLETALEYGTVLHGEAVALGIVLAARLSERHGWIESDVTKRIMALFETAGLATTLPAVNKTKLLAAIGHDKKTLVACPRLVALESLGSAFVCDQITIQEFEAFLDDNLDG